MPDPLHFDRHSTVYERARPPYPDALWERLRELGVLGPGVRVLELGAGAGLATGPMLGAGALVTAVEPGPRLADRLRHLWPAATVLVGAAEHVPLPDGAFDVAVAATAVHWFDLDVVLPRLHRALVPGGRFAVWRHTFGDPAAALTPFRERVRTIAAHRVGEKPRPGPGELETDAWVRRLSDGGLFAAAHVEEFRWSVDLSAEQIHDLFTTFSDWSAAEVDEAAQAVRDLGGWVTEHYLTPLVVLDRVPRVEGDAG